MPLRIIHVPSGLIHEIRKASNFGIAREISEWYSSLGVKKVLEVRIYGR